MVESISARERDVRTWPTSPHVRCPHGHAMLSMLCVHGPDLLPGFDSLFAPLTGLEVRATRVEGSALVVNVALSVNLVALTIEQAVEYDRRV